MSAGETRGRTQWIVFFSITLLALLGVGGYVAWSTSQGLVGFPLDDAWIHQTYARNLAESGQLAFLPGQPSAGSTSPAWSFLLSVGYLLGVDFRAWAYLLGSLSLAAAAWLTYRLCLRLIPSRPTAALLAGLLCAVEWHLVWAAASGMETMLYTALSLALVEYFLSVVAGRRSPDRPASLQKEQAIVSAIGIGLMGGILTLSRPEGLGLAGLVIAGLIFWPRPTGWSETRSRLVAAAVSLAGLALVLAPYVAFNLRTSGAIWPNTFYAKQIEYQVHWSLPVRFWWVLRPTLSGAQVLLVPGFLYAAYRLVRQRDWPALVPWAWWLASLLVYAVRLPVSYQHGRYAMPTIPLLILYGTWGTALLLQPRASQLAVRVLSRGLVVATALLALFFGLRGAQAYREDVGFIEGEMVATARWLNENTAPDELIAVHDIGAAGYLVERPMLDLAGLITPEVIPFMTDAEQLAGWMDERGAAYAVFFPDFSSTYAQLAVDARFQQVHCTGYAWTLAMGHENLCAYRVVRGNQR